MQLLALLPLLASIAEARHLPLRRYRQNQPNKQHHQHARALEMDAGFGLDERGLPITATTTVVVDMTSTQTIWVAPTGQVPMQPEPSASVSITDTSSASASASASGSESDSSSLPSVSTEAASPSATSSPSDSMSSGTSASASYSEWISSSIPASASASASDWSSSAISTDSADSASASPTSSSSSAEVSSSMASASSTWSASDSGPSPSANATTLAPSSSAAESASDASPTSQSESLTKASYSSSSISSGSASISSSAMASQSVSASANATASMSDWSASSSSARSSASASSSAVASSTSSASNNTSASASASASLSSSDQSSSSSILPSSTSASASSASPSHSSAAPLPDRMLMAGYYPDWSAWTLPPESVDWNKFDVVDFAFAIPTWDGRLEFTQWDSSDLLNRLVTGAHRAGKRVKLSIGGWTGSKYFSPIMSDYNQRQNFVKNCVQAYWAYSLDGIDIDWEYPNSGGAQGNIISSADSANFLLFLQELRAALPDGALITLATQVWPFAGPDGRPLSDVSGFAKVIDWILIMNYDIWGSSDNPGPNAPLSDACGTSTQPLANAYASVASWTSAGLPAHKISLGVPAYGYLQKSWATQLRTRDYIPPSADESANLTSSLIPIHKRQNGIVTVRNGGGGDDNGQLGFADLVKQGALALDSSGKYIGAGGFYREWDRCSSTPWLRSSHTGQVVTYDDPDSLSLKAQFARQSGLRAVNMFSMDGDWNGSGWPLTDSLRSGMGI